MNLEPAVMYTGGIFPLAEYPCGSTPELLIEYPGFPCPANGGHQTDWVCPWFMDLRRMITSAGFSSVKLLTREIQMYGVLGNPWPLTGFLNALPNPCPSYACLCFPDPKSDF